MAYESESSASVADFDPRSLGLKEIKDEEFDPTSLGLKEVSDSESFDPASFGLREVSDDEVNDPRMSGVDEVSVAQGSEPTSNVFADLGRRLGAGTAESGTDAIAGLFKSASDLNQVIPDSIQNSGPYGNLKTILSSALRGIKSKMDTDGSSVVDKSLQALEVKPHAALMQAAQEMRDLSERSKSDYKVDPKRDQDFASKVASGAGSLIPVIAAGPAAPVAMAGMMGESGRKDAEQSGATKAQQDVSFYANAAVGAISEGIMGMPALIRSIKAGKITEGAAKEMATSIATQAVKSYAREGSQEAIEQAAGNAVAKWVAAYDPEREITEGVKESFLVGGAIGAPTGALFQAAENFSTPKKIEEAVETETAADVVDETLRETALSTPPPPVTPQSTDVVTLPGGSTIVMEPQEIPAVEPTVEPAPVEEITVEPTEIPSEKIPSEVPQQQESQTPQEPPKVVTKDDVANAIMPFRDQAVRLAESMGSMGNVEADNIVDDAISTLMTKVDEGDFSSGKKDLKNPRALLMSFVQNKVRDLRKHLGAAKHGSNKVISMEGQDIENAAVETEGPRAKMLQKEDLEQIRKAIDTFTPTEKRVGQMLMDEMTVEEIAEELEMAVGSVKNIRTRLAQELGPYAKRMGLGKPTPPGAASAEEELVKYAFSKFSERVQKSDPELYERMENVYYEPIPMHVNEKRAMELVEKNGPDAVANQVQDLGNELTFADRSTAALAIVGFWKRQADLNRETNPILANQLLDKAADLASWARAYGTSLGQGVNAFKAWGKNLKLAKMIALMQEANGGVPLTSDQRDFINEIDKDETETEERLDARITALEEEASQSHSDDVLSDRLKEQDKPEPLVLSIAERIEKIIQRNADAARARIRDRLMHARSGFDPVVAYDVMWLAAEQISKGIRKLSDWRKYAKNEFGEDIEPYIDQAWEDANAQIDKMVEGEVPEKKREPVKRIVKKMSTEEVREELTKRITREAKEGGKLEDMVPLIRRLADAFIASGIRTRDPLVDALHAVIEPILPGTTKREVRDAFSGYGRFRELSKDDVSQVRRDLSAQSQLVSKYEDIKSGKPLKKSGVERTPTSDEQRRLSKLVEEAKRVHGVKVTDPARQLKSAQDAIKTRLKNEIKDMARQIETGEKPPGKSQTEWDAEIERLKSQRDRMKDVLSSLEDTKIPEESRIKNAERALEKSIEEIQRRIKNTETKTTKGTPLESEKLSVLRAQKEVLMAELDELRSADTALQEEKAFDALMKKKDQLEKQIASGDLFPATKEKPEDTELVKEAREMVNELHKQLADARRSSPESRKAQLDKAIASVESSIKALDARLQAGDLSARESSPEVTTPELERLRAERAAMVKELNRQRREAAKPSESEAQAKKDAKQIENLEKSIAALTQKINTKDLSTKPRKPLSTPEAQKLADYKKYLNDFLNDMRRASKPKRTAEEVAMKAFKTRTAKEILRLEERISKGDFSKRKPKQLDLSKDPEAVKLRAKINEVRQRFEKERLLTERKNRTGLQKTMDTAKEVLNLPRNMMSSMDFSAVLRQGGMLAFAHPVKAIKALKPMFQSAVSQDKFNELQASIESRPNNQNGTYKEAGLYLAETGDVKLSKKEEAIMSELGDKLPWVKASNRAYVAFLNQMRADSFDVLYEQLKKNGTPTEAELKALGNFVNVATGRGNFANHNEGAATLALFLFSPRLMVSRFQLLMGQPLWKGSGRTRTMIAKEYGKAALAVATFSMLAIMAGADYEDDSTSSDFGKLRFGNTRVDPWMGLIQPLVLASRAYHGSVKNGKGKTVPIREDAGKVPYGQARWSELAQKFVRSKLNPTVGGAFDLISGENVVGEKTTAAGTAARMLTPLSIQDMGKVWEEHGMAKGTALNLLGILGMGVQNYEQRSDSKQRALEIMASPR